MGKKSPGHIEQLPSGSWRVKVYGGTDPLTGREIRLRKTCKTERAAQIELGKLLEQAAAGRQPETDATVAQLMDRYAEVADWDLSTRKAKLTRPGDTPGQHPPAAFRYRPDRERHPGPPDSRDPLRRRHEISTEAGRAAVASTQPDHGHFPLHPGTGPGKTHARPQAADPRCAAGRADPRARQAGRSQCHRNALRRAQPETRRAQVPANLDPSVPTRIVSEIGGRCLEVAGGSLVQGAYLQTYHCTPNNPAQIFVVG